jgi:hypothetical protein
MAFGRETEQISEKNCFSAKISHLSHPELNPTLRGERPDPHRLRYGRVHIHIIPTNLLKIEVEPIPETSSTMLNIPDRRDRAKRSLEQLQCNASIIVTNFQGISQWSCNSKEPLRNQ